MARILGGQSLKWIVLVCCALALVVMSVFVGMVAPVSAEPVSAEELDDTVSGAVNALVGLLPMVFVVMVILMVLKTFMGGDTPEEKAVDDYWPKYAERVKLAYSAKFGGENKGFNEEVDKRVAIMVNNGKGFTRAMAKRWLKRMHKFVEAK